ncbi:hypothetical protein K438DRAFT_1768747 [Mycena galopus ATCC 62051]|nr:hypothetical protein K438DRAFT_1768747 [Mycena galopus ATCC 62051]
MNHSETSKFGSAATSRATRNVTCPRELKILHCHSGPLHQLAPRRFHDSPVYCVYTAYVPGASRVLLDRQFKPHNSKLAVLEHRVDSTNAKPHEENVLELAELALVLPSRRVELGVPPTAAKPELRDANRHGNLETKLWDRHRDGFRSTKVYSILIHDEA